MPAKQNPKNKKWRFRKMVEGTILRSRYIYLTKKEAELAETEAVQTFSKTGQIITQPPKVSGAQTISELFAERVNWLERHRSARYASNMDSLFTRALDLAPRYASKPVLSFGIETAQRMIDDLAGWTAKSRADFIRYAQAAWNHPWGSRRAIPTFPHNPWQYIERPAQNYKIKYVPTKKEVAKIRMAADGEFRLWIEIEIETGARVGEALTLAWEDVGLDYVVLHTRKTAGGHRQPRKLEISKALRKRFLSWRKQQADGVLFVFQQTHQERPHRKVWVRKQLASACAAAKVKVFPPGSFRHYRASLWAAEGVPLTTIQARLGHSKATTTDNYLRELKAR